MIPVSELYSLLVPLAEGRLIVPRSCIAEVVGFGSMESVADAPTWLMGAITWHETPIPVISFEGACGRTVPDIGKRSRIAVFNALSDHLPVRNFGLVTQGFPQLVRVNADVLSLYEEEEIPANYPVLCQLRMMNERPYIPDIEKLEELVGEHYAEPA